MPAVGRLWPGDDDDGDVDDNNNDDDDGDDDDEPALGGRWWAGRRLTSREMQRRCRYPSTVQHILAFVCR